jgi:hypothetical protein
VIENNGQLIIQGNCQNHETFLQEFADPAKFMSGIFIMQQEPANIEIITTSMGSSLSVASFLVFLAFDENDNTALVT